jgi:hypothetical protein
VHEIKHDGYRIEALVGPPRVRLLTRNGLDWTDRLGIVVKELAALKVRNAIIDAEAVVLNEAGLSDFQALQRETAAGRKRKRRCAHGHRTRARDDTRQAGSCSFTDTAAACKPSRALAPPPGP